MKRKREGKPGIQSEWAFAARSRVVFRFLAFHLPDPDEGWCGVVWLCGGGVSCLEGEGEE